MQLDRVEIEDFRGIHHLGIDLDAQTTIIGEPDGGKSSLLRAIGRALDPHQPGKPPRFEIDDFHRRDTAEASRADRLTITLGLRGEDDDPLLPEDPRVRNGVRDGGVGLRVTATRRGDQEPETSVAWVDRAGQPLHGVDGAAYLQRLRSRHPAIIVGTPRRAMARAGDDASSGSRLQAMLVGAAGPDAPLTWDQLADVREDLVQAAGALADELGPPQQRRRTPRDMADTPRPLLTDLGAALQPGAGQRRRIAALWLLVTILDAIPEEGLGAEAEPILLFDDIEANLHPSWLAAYAAVALNLPFQEVVATHSPEVLAWVPISSIRRLVREPGHIEVRQVRAGGYSTDELRRLAYHLRLRRGNSFFARCWVLVEGETEAWLLPEFARIAGVEFPIEGIRIIEFAQAGFKALAKVADDLGIAWLLVADGDEAGQNYIRAAEKHIAEGGGGTVVKLPARDIEHYLFEHGYREVIRKAAGRSPKRKADELIRVAVDKVSKPGLALLILAAADERGPSGVPPAMAQAAQTAMALARGNAG